MRHNPERLAWTVLVISLLLCIGLAIAVPLTISGFINNTTEQATITLDVQQGTVLVQRTLQDDWLGVTTSLANIPEGAKIRTDGNALAWLTIQPAHADTTLLTVQIYGSTSLDIVHAHSPRFDQSGLAHQIDLSVGVGRVRVNVVGTTQRPINAVLMALQATIQLQQEDKNGAYTIDVSNDEVQVTVREGAATVSAGGADQTVGPLQRTMVKLGSRPAGILPLARNLVINGNFSLPLPGTWDFSYDRQEPSESYGQVKIITDGGSQAALFQRTGIYHAETSLRQVINKDVRSFQSLKLHFIVKVIYQDVPVCGQAGSECPMMMRLDYKDADGTDRSYLQGFYWQLDPNNINPDYNTTSGARIRHIRVQRNLSYTYESSDNLMTTLQPSQITAITFYASGHSYEASIAEVELVGEQ